MKEIHITGGFTVKVDDEDYPRLIKHKWFAKWGGCNGRPYAARSERYKKSDGSFSYRTIRMHREIMYAPPFLDVDHNDTETMNNQKYNLQIMTNEENRKRRSRNEAVGVTNNDGEAVSDIPF